MKPIAAGFLGILILFPVMLPSWVAWAGDFGFSLVQVREECRRQHAKTIDEDEGDSSNIDWNQCVENAVVAAFKRMHPAGPMKEDDFRRLLDDHKMSFYSLRDMIEGGNKACPCGSITGEFVFGAYQRDLHHGLKVMDALSKRRPPAPRHAPDDSDPVSPSTKRMP